MFRDILCANSARLNGNINFGLATCFYSYFKQINKASNAMQLQRKKLRIADFSALQGMDALWQISLQALDLDTRDLIHDLMADLHLKIVDKEALHSSAPKFIEKCMESINSPGAVSLLSLYLDKYEGKRVRADPNVKSYSGFKPVKIIVNNCMNTEKLDKDEVSLHYYQTLGFLREQVAQKFGLQINEFVLIIKNQLVDVELDDHKYFKDITGMFTMCLIKRNPDYNPAAHPKF